MFFLVAVLVPQYRYNIRMAAFYAARADSIRLAGTLQPITRLDELEKAIVAMTPNIDFCKAPATRFAQSIKLTGAASQKRTGQHPAATVTTPYLARASARAVWYSASALRIASAK